MILEVTGETYLKCSNNNDEFVFKYQLTFIKLASQQLIENNFNQSFRFIITTYELGSQDKI